MPDEPKQPEQEKPKKSRRTYYISIWFLLASIVGIVLFYRFFSGEEETILYSDFKQFLRDGKVVRVSIGESTITGEFKRTSATGKSLTFTTVKVDDPELIQELEVHQVQYSGKESRTWLSELFSWIVPIAILVVLWFLIFRRFGPSGSIMSFGKSRAKFYEEDETKITFGDVAGIDEAKEELVEIIDFLKSPDKFTRLGGKIPKGALIVGAPGTGKTLLAKAVAGEAKVPFLSISGSAFVELFVGVGASRVRDLFNQAESKAPCIIFIDELDALGKTRGVGPVGGHDEREQTLNQLLVEMDGFDSRNGVIIMAATNRPEILDAALLRPGRFDRQIFVDRPDIKGREQILQVHAKDVKLAEDVDLKVMAGRTPGFVGADLANVINEAALLAARRDKQAVEMSDLEEAIDRVVAGLEKKSRVMSKKEKEITAYHEAGHALIASQLPNATPVHKVSIIPRGLALGITMFLPPEDRYLMTKAELLDQIGTALGGRVAEELIFNEMSSGARDDLQRATDIARMMVTEFGMSAKIGLVTFEGRHRSPFLPGQGYFEEGYSDETAYQIDVEVKNILDDTYIKVRTILEKHIETLKELAELLLEKEVIESEEFERIVNKQNSEARIQNSEDGSQKTEDRTQKTDEEISHVVLTSDF
jgi:cell division protease FtsH